jgi:2-oxoglutarate dehydrogenase E1 component
MVTQPLMYANHRQASGYPQIYADKLMAEGTLPDEPDQMIRNTASIWIGRTALQPGLSGYKQQVPVDWMPFLKQPNYRRPAIPVDSDGGTEALVPASDACPEGFTLHSRVKKIINDRAAMGEGRAAARLGYG